MFNKILVAIDGSEMGNKALEAAISIAQEQNARISLLHVGRDAVTSSYMIGGIAYIPEDYIVEMEESLKKEGEALLNEAKAKAEAASVPAEAFYVKGDPARQILDRAEEGGYHLIVIGSRGLSGFKEMMLGSVSHKVSQLSKCPVLIVK
ncbi:universal stress protein [Aneurinibacillus migulanus]|uniref:universal stress protein n=1 Tax=Aneurinibacillus migulanus TaxID=47500 RepID=UPI0005BA794C|nr:universal stress protein [Aneurinibacillus migulanus]KIV53681.1 universal stress protein [Aneurinibacillus migulanus]KPD08966.1 universal stress protein [Aneurinibacillus migulanus]MCP1357695.1 universal stress protein [Aneurinibacillus migulanus]MED4731011.1 universal stress protein [Aneurinibacillus migulanus]CEH30316.1 Universal stress protein [Aneurinibacillus migulanus]